jgi:hypothetical protein
MSPRQPVCPLCGRAFEIKYVDFELPFRCPNCKHHLRVPPLYPRAWTLVAFLASGTLWFALGARGFGLFCGALLTWIPVFFVLVLWTRHFAPPKLKPCPSGDSDYSGPLGLGHG